nr:type II toxin-antitoxin system PemK/MazF family toxin [Deltaproteobacteria bacterium]
MKVERGTLVLVELDPTVGHEQRGVRPCVAVSDPVVNADQRFRSSRSSPSPTRPAGALSTRSCRRARAASRRRRTP